MSTRISNIAQLPEALRTGHESYFDEDSGDVKPAYYSSTSSTGTSYFIGHYELFAPDVVPYTPPPVPPDPPEPTELELEQATAETQRADAERALELALETYLAIPSPDEDDRIPVTEAEARLSDCTELVRLLSA